ncbi:hypothetical protein [Deinococcus planocerae]|uniref:hypothetical protein n=1 Tax=Deinococcus planocerae TaxID=1737569 RepID=UPI001FE8C880|nr:hypothetical protein [Deinococcus planocerae]
MAETAPRSRGSVPNNPVSPSMNGLTSGEVHHGRRTITGPPDNSTRHTCEARLESPALSSVTASAPPRSTPAAGG